MSKPQVVLTGESDGTLPLLPLKDIVVFPHMIIPVFINEDLCVSAVEEAVAGERKIFLSAFKVEEEKSEDTQGIVVNKALESTLDAPFDVYNIGTVCSIMRTRKLPDGRMKVLVQGLYKGRINRLERANPHPVVSVDKISDPAFETKSADIEAMIRAVREHLEKVVSLGKVLSPDILMILEDVKEPGRLADLVAANLGLKVNEAQSILAIYHPVERLTRVHHFLSREIEVYQMQVRIQSQAKEEIGRMQREHYLREQIRALRNELGDGDQKDDIDEFWKKIESIKLSDHAKEEISKQIKRLERMHQESSEATITRTYIETVFSMPWGTVTSDNIDLKNVANVLEEDHHGLGQVKDRIIEYMAVKKLNAKAKSPIICFVGPPGVGKTSLGKSIARSMGRNFARIALGGVSDEADIRGHRKTYIGAYPGRVIQAIKQAGSTNPIIMLDEIDKLGSSHRGDPSSALLEILDPAQNHSFVDHYLGIEFDLSNIMFIANANTLDTIPAPLRDRLEIIEVSGYSEEEKLVIANRFLIPRQITDAGLNEDEVIFSKSAISTLINHYTRESGLRGLNKKIASICRKIARHAAEYRDEQIEKNKTEKPMPAIRVTPAAVKRYLGANIFSGEFYYKETIVGVSFGLAYTQYGGEVLAIETSLLPSNNAKLVLTGQLGDVMKESAQTAYSFVRANAKILGIAKETIDSHELHLHIPAGAIPKDGPSAGIAITSSMISALLSRAPKARIAMTGEITLNGLVLPIGGLKEKVLAAQREGIEMILVPEGNKEQLLELPINVRKKSTFVLVKNYTSVFSALFGDNVVEIPLRTPSTNSDKIAS